MPEAVDSISTSAPIVQLGPNTDIVHFRRTVMKARGLFAMANAFISLRNDSLTSDGISISFEELLADLHNVADNVHSDIRTLKCLAMRIPSTQVNYPDFEFGEEHKRFNRLLAKDKTRYVGTPLRLHPLAKIALEQAASKHGRSLQNLACIVLTQWLLREGWLQLPEDETEEAGQ